MDCTLPTNLFSVSIDSSQIMGASFHLKNAQTYLLQQIQVYYYSLDSERTGEIWDETQKTFL